MRSEVFALLVVVLVRRSLCTYAATAAIAFTLVSALLTLGRVTAVVQTVGPDLAQLQLGPSGLEVVAAGVALACAGWASEAAAKSEAERNAAAVGAAPGVVVAYFGLVGGEFDFVVFALVSGLVAIQCANHIRTASTGAVRRGAMSAIGFAALSIACGLAAAAIFGNADALHEDVLLLCAAASATHALAIAASVCWLAAVLPSPGRREQRARPLLRRTAMACGVLSAASLELLGALLAQRTVLADAGVVGALVLLNGALVVVALAVLAAWKRHAGRPGHLD